MHLEVLRLFRLWADPTYALRRRNQVALKPIACQACHFVERARFFEEVRRARDNYELFCAAQMRERCSVQPDDLHVVPADDQ